MTINRFKYVLYNLSWPFHENYQIIFWLSGLEISIRTYHWYKSALLKEACPFGSASLIRLVTKIWHVLTSTTSTQVDFKKSPSAFENAKRLRPHRDRSRSHFATDWTLKNNVFLAMGVLILTVIFIFFFMTLATPPNQSKWSEVRTKDSKLHLLDGVFN